MAQGNAFLNKMGAAGGGVPSDLVLCATGNFGDAVISGGSSITAQQLNGAEYIAISMTTLTSNVVAIGQATATNTGCRVYKIVNNQANIGVGASNSRAAWVAFKHGT